MVCEIWLKSHEAKQSCQKETHSWWSDCEIVAPGFQTVWKLLFRETQKVLNLQVWQIPARDGLLSYLPANSYYQKM